MRSNSMEIFRGWSFIEYNYTTHLNVSDIVQIS